MLMKTDNQTVANADPVISLKNVSKIFKARVRIRRGDRKQRLNLVLALCGISMSDKQKQEDVIALSNVNVRIFPARVTGITGESGCGKSTLMKVVSGVTPLNEGIIEVRGRVARLLNMDDINQNFTGTDFLKDEAHGKKKWKAEQLQKLLEFAGLTDFAEVPVRKYSTGMRLRLAMASVLNQDADIYLVDDYKAVGDLEFQAKCRDKIISLARSGAAVVIASNDVKLLEELCDDVVWMRQGTVQDSGEAGRIFKDVVSDLEQNTVSGIPTLVEPMEQVVTRLVHASVREHETGEKGGFTTDSSLKFRIVIQAKEDIDRARLAFTLFNRKKQVLRSVFREAVSLKKGEFLKTETILPGNILAPGLHDVEIIVEPEWTGERDTIKFSSALSFSVSKVKDREEIYQFSDSKDVVIAAPDFKWSCRAE